MLGLLNNVIPFSLMFTGQTEIGAGLASVLNATTPFWTMILASMLTTDERLTWQKAAGILLGIAGVAVMIGPGAHRRPRRTGLGKARADRHRALLLLRTHLRAPLPRPAATGRGHRSAHRLHHHHDPCGSAHPEARPACLRGTPGSGPPCFALALLSTAFAYILYFGILSSAGATNASLVTLLVPVSATLLSVAFLGERLGSFELAGMALIGLGLLTIDGRLFRRR